jgi:hypothetical protein
VRRLVIELYGKELQRRLEGTPFPMLESMELIHTLRNDQNEHTGIWRMVPRLPWAEVEAAIKRDPPTREFQVLEREGGGAFLVMLRRTSRPGMLLGHGSRPGSGYLEGPLGFKDGRLRFSFVGNQKQVREIIEGAEERGLSYRVVSMTDADFAEDSLLHLLTEKQRKILMTAYALGYYDVPKKVNSDELGARLHLSGSTVVEHLNKAERRLLDGIIRQA